MGVKMGRVDYCPHTVLVEDFKGNDIMAFGCEKTPHRRGKHRATLKGKTDQKDKETTVVFTWEG